MLYPIEDIYGLWRRPPSLCRNCQMRLPSDKALYCGPKCQESARLKRKDIVRQPHEVVPPHGQKEGR